MKSKPENSEEVYQTMKGYCTTKQYNFSEDFLRFMAEDCYLCFESKGWNQSKYWPALAMRWVLRNVDKQLKQRPPTKDTIRGKLLGTNDDL